MMSPEHRNARLKSGQTESSQFRFPQYGRAVYGRVNEDGCDLLLPPAHQVRIEENSTLDFTGYRHLIEMPNLKAFSGAGSCSAGWLIYQRLR